MSSTGYAALQGTMFSAVGAGLTSDRAVFVRDAIRGKVDACWSLVREDLHRAICVEFEGCYGGLTGAEAAMITRMVDAALRDLGMIH